MQAEPILTERAILGAGRARDRMAAFLRENALEMEPDIEYSMCLMDGERFAAAGSLAGNVVKCVAVDPAYRALGLSARLISALEREAFSRGRTHLFVYTKPENVALFEGLGFSLVVACAAAALLENRRGALASYVRALSALRGPDGAGAVVLNANPFTNGHLHLVRQAALRQGCVHVFVVGEDRSRFSTAVRERLVREGTRGVAGVTVHGGSPYVLSGATFPSYFLKSVDGAARAHAQLDLTLFGRFIAPALGVVRRFAGEEPLSPSTRLYNDAMCSVLPPLGVEVEIFPRTESDGEPISASRVRALWEAGRVEAARALVPESTFRYLLENPPQGAI